VRANQRAWAGQFARQHHAAAGFVERQIIFQTGFFKKLGDDFLVHARELAHVDRRQMKAKNLDRAQQPAQAAMSKARAPIGGQRIEDDLQVGQQRRSVGIGFGLHAAA